MANVLVMTDTVACIPQELAKELNIKIIPAAILNINGKEYIENIDISAEEAYDYLKQNADSFSTTPVKPEYLLEQYRKLGPEHKDILFIPMSSALSALMKSVIMMADEYKKEAADVNIRIVDAKAVAGTQGLVVLAAAKAAAKGMSLDEVASVAEKTRAKTGGLMMLDTLKYIYRTGRMSKMKARLISFFNIRPINKMMDDGTIEIVDRTRKREKGLEKLAELIGKEAGTDSLHFAISHSAAREMAEGFAKALKAKYNCLSILISDYSPVMGYGGGPGCIFVGFHEELGFVT